ncbi:hypothetical protein DFA_05681 [Cavenderia fasciculata]|uniref:TLDc domain-containing protein n=1 Tax=Cavenderia fasciculata TaxID=261658 RepID=F4PLZ4_CACFS|nr:uncharacterized protein DFA_05681 [Cavenderia fasciculata]EGG23548.1 hypothetical protein DFA_05681 [Cavenderia fasciculata]|eukprot:XP_004361399.1 hypothetical protein DFA_05681 [Cavenderia fasciculata]
MAINHPLQIVQKVPGSYFYKLVASSIVSVNQENTFIDRDGTHFGLILNYIRDGDISIFPKNIMNVVERELIFYGLPTPSPSSLLTSEQVSIINGTKDGFEAETIHKNIDGKGATVLWIKTNDGNIFGGFNNQSWDSSDKYGGDMNCFIFSIVNKQGLPPTKYLPKGDGQIVYGSLQAGPTLGRGHDFKINDQCNTNFLSYQKFPSSYIDTTGKGLYIDTNYKF